MFEYCTLHVPICTILFLATPTQAPLFGCLPSYMLYCLSEFCTLCYQKEIDVNFINVGAVELITFLQI